MGKYQRFEELPVWQEAARLYQRVLDVVEEPNVPLSPTFRNQLERAALGISNCVAEGFDGLNSSELRSLLANARGAAIEIQNMMALIVERPKAARLKDALVQIRASADSCVRQLAAWKHALDNPRKPAADQGAAPGQNAPPPRNQGGYSARANT
jgi:four helix bundle protein